MSKTKLKQIYIENSSESSSLVVQDSKLVLTKNSNKSLLLPSGLTADRPIVPVNGMVRYNSSLNIIEGYSNSSWISLGSNLPFTYYTFVMTYNNLGNNISSITMLPVGWSVVTALPASIITFDTGTTTIVPKFVSYYGFNGTIWNYRTPTATQANITYSTAGIFTINGLGSSSPLGASANNNVVVSILG